MKTRRSHYELAFEAHLNRRGTPYVAVEDVRHFVQGRMGIKAFDYIVYPPGGKPCLVDVKGRKSRPMVAGQDCRQRTWVTRKDVDGLTEWMDIFGPDYDARFVFAYWIPEMGEALAAPTEAEPKAEWVRFASRQYSFWLVGLPEYSQHTKLLSQRWDTVHVPREEFRRISHRLEAMWPAAPC